MQIHTFALYERIELDINIFEWCFFSVQETSVYNRSPQPGYSFLQMWKTSTITKAIYIITIKGSVMLVCKMYVLLLNIEIGRWDILILY